MRGGGVGRHSSLVATWLACIGLIYHSATKQNTLKPKGLRKSKIRKKKRIIIHSFISIYIPTYLSIYHLFIYVFWDRVSLCWHSWPGTQYVDNVGLKIPEIYLSLPPHSTRLVVLKLLSLGKKTLGNFVDFVGVGYYFSLDFLEGQLLPTYSLSFLCDMEPMHE